MDPLLIALIVLVVIALSGWGYGTYSRPVVAPGAVVEAGPAWVSPLGIIGLLAVIAVIAMLVTGWRPFVVVPGP
jgi:hypothetical protein